jgi:hypothetical protein
MFMASPPPAIGQTKKSGNKSRPDLQRLNNPKTRHGKAAMFSQGGFVRSADGIASKGKTKAKQVKM